MKIMEVILRKWFGKKKKKKEEKGSTNTNNSSSIISKPEKWRSLSGENHWNGLLDPALDKDLRQYILHYGEMAQATYDSFNMQKESKYAGGCLYSKSDFFSKVWLEKGHANYKYTVTKFLYATSVIDVPDAFLIKSLSREAWGKESNWIGYIAVATDEGKALLGRRDIVIAWRGTIVRNWSKLE